MEGLRPIAGLESFEEGVVKAFIVEGRDVAVVRRQGRFFAFENCCTHSAYSFTGLRLRPDGTLVCAAHFATFEPASGRVLQGPAAEDLRTYEVAVRDGQVWLALRRKSDSTEVAR